MDRQQAKNQAWEAIEAVHSDLIRFGEDIRRHPELGYQENRTAQRILSAFQSIGVTGVTRPAVTGVKGWLINGAGPRIAVIGEMDGVISPEHPSADPQTGAAHACGHNAQLTSMLGCAVGLRAVEPLLTGAVCLIAAPAEEYIQINSRKEMMEEGVIQYLGGKQQMIAEGAFDDVDMAMMVHGETNAPCLRAVVGGHSTGFIGKQITFIGKEAHAGGAPWNGINALNAATLAISAIHANRETFPDEDQIRVHPIITRGGDLVNTVPSHVEMESYVRGATAQAMCRANAIVNRAVTGAAFAVGAKAEIQDLPGYLPMEQNQVLGELFAENAMLAEPKIVVERGLAFCGSTDMGDLSSVMPVIQPTVSGFSGDAHSKDFCVSDPYAAYILPAKIMAATIIDLLFDGAEKAKKICNQSNRRTKEEYMDLWKQLLDETKAGKIQ